MPCFQLIFVSILHQRRFQGTIPMLKSQLACESSGVSMVGQEKSRKTMDSGSLRSPDDLSRGSLLSRFFLRGASGPRFRTQIPAGL